MSTMHDDDMLLSGGTGELTIDNIHNLTSEQAAGLAACGCWAGPHCCRCAAHASCFCAPPASLPITSAAAAAPQHSGRIPSYTELGSAGLSLSSLPPPLQHLPQHTGPTHIGDIIPKARPTSSSASSQLSVEVPRRSGVDCEQ